MTYGTINKSKHWRLPKNSAKVPSTKNFAKVEKMFYLSRKIQEKVNDVRANQGFYNSGHKEGGGSSNHAFISDPTSSIAIKRVEPIKSVTINSGELNNDVVVWPEKWLYVVNTTLEVYGENTFVGKILRARYLRNESQPRTCIELDIEPGCYNKYYNARTEGIQFAKELAIQVGLLTVV